MNSPAWIDEKLSNDLPMIRAKGETQEIEFKRDFPHQVTDLAKEIAAFATSNTGTILIGIEDNGDLLGLEGLNDPIARDGLLRRLEGICSGSIKPAVTPRVTWAIEDNCIVLAITVPKGSEPVYYSQGKPYLRHITTARPAEPHEVIALIRQHLGSHLEPDSSNDESQDSAFYSKLSAVLHRILVWAETPAEQRMINPWLEAWRADYSYEANNLRELSADDAAHENALEEKMRELASALDEVASFQLTLGCGNKLEAAASRAKMLTYSLKQIAIDPIPLSNRSVEQVRTLIREKSRIVADLASRAQEMADLGKTDELQSEVGSIGFQLMQLSFYNLSDLGRNVGCVMRDVGLSMRLLEVARIYMDGGASLQSLVEEVTKCAERLSELANMINDAPSQ